MKRLVCTVLLLTLVFLVSCEKREPEVPESPSIDISQLEPETTEDQTEEIQEREEVYRSYSNAGPITLNSIQATDEMSLLLIGNTQTGLYSMGLNQRAENDMAWDYHYDEASLTYTFTLRDSQWVTHLGESYAPVRAQDFEFAWKELINPANDAGYAYLLETTGIKNAKAIRDQFRALERYDALREEVGETPEAERMTLEETLIDTHGSVEQARENAIQSIDTLGVVALDNKRLQVTLERAMPNFIDMLVFPAFSPINKSFYEEMGTRYGTQKEYVLYNGAFILSEWKPGEIQVLEKNSKYWEAHETALDRIEILEDSSITSEEQVELYLNEAIDRASLSGNLVEKYGNRPDAIRLFKPVTFFLEFNQEGQPLLQDPDFRKAISMAINKVSLTEDVLNNGSVPTGYFVPERFFRTKNGDDYRSFSEDLGGEDGYHPYNPEESLALWEMLKERHHIEEVTLNLIGVRGPLSKNIMDSIKKDLEESLPGLTLSSEDLPYEEQNQRISDGSYDLSFTGWGPDYPDPLSFLEMYLRGSSYNSKGYDNEDYNTLINRVKSMISDQDRFKVLAQAEEILLGDDQAIIPLFQQGQLVLQNPKVKNQVDQVYGPGTLYKHIEFE